MNAAPAAATVLPIAVPSPARRRWLAAAAMLAGAPVARALSRSLPSFPALNSAAAPVRHTAGAVLQGAAQAGSRIVAVGERGIVALSDDAARSWRQARRVPVGVGLTAVRFADAQRGWAVGHGGVVLATRDAGETWELQADGEHLAQAAQAAARLVPERPALTKEADALAASGPDKPLLDLHVVDARRVMVVGAYNLAFETDDGGSHWSAALQRIDNPKGLHLYALAARGDTWLLAGEQGLLLRSRDAGRSFQRLAPPHAASWFAAAPAGSEGWVIAGLRGHAWRSSNDGDSWMRIEGAPAVSFVSMAAQPDGGLLLVNQAGQIHRLAPGTSALAPLVPDGLPPLTQVLPLPDGQLLALGLTGARRLLAPHP